MRLSYNIRAAQNKKNAEKAAKEAKAESAATKE